MIIRFLVIIFFLLACPGWATTYYVTQAGSGDADGSSYANSMSVATHNSGTFSGSDTVYLCGTITSAINPPSSGTSGHPIIYDGTCPSGSAALIDRQYSPAGGWTLYSGNIYQTTITSTNYGLLWEGDEPTGNPSGYQYQLMGSLGAVVAPGQYYKTGTTVYAWTSDGSDPDTKTMRMAMGYGIGLNNKSYLTFKNMSGQYVTYAFYFVSASSNHITIQDSVFSSMGYGIYASGTYMNDSVFTGNTLSYVGPYTLSADAGDGILVHGSRNEVSYNDISWVSHNAILISGYPSYTTEDNIVNDNTVMGSISSCLGDNYNTNRSIWKFNSVSACTGSGIQADGNNGVFYSNIFEDCRTGGLSLYSSSSRTITGNKFFNNTLINTIATGATEPASMKAREYSSGTVTGNYFINNLVYESVGDVTYQIWVDGPATNENYFQNNLLYRAGGSANVRTTDDGTKTIAYMETNYTSQYSGHISGDPLFSSSTNFSLLPLSPAINAGTDVGLTVDMDGHKVPDARGRIAIGAKQPGIGQHLMRPDGRQIMQ